VPALDMPIVIRGRPFHGQATLEVRGRPGAEVEVWKLDSDLEKTALTGSATIESDLEPWTDAHLGTSLAAGDLIGVQYQGDDASMVFDTVWADWPQIIGFDSLVARVGGSGGSLGLLGYNFTSDMTVELRTTDGALHDLAVTFNSATSATVELPALATDQLGPGTLYCISPGQDVDTHGASIAHITICEEAEE